MTRFPQHVEQLARARIAQDNAAATAMNQTQYVQPFTARYNPKIVLAYFAECGVPAPVMEYAFAAPARKWRFDFAWVTSRVALEVEGGIWTRGAHGRGSGIVRDLEKYNAATLRGWRVLRVQPKELCMSNTVEMLKTALCIAAQGAKTAKTWRGLD